ncbi:hypothetical protein AVEN_155679-1 [Araneus ventricosus]|uniref:Uncharacterized protein n=1 Tax=Araneus ventricosus TaxID=182803 RepID=A0A4Y2LWW3_ARAVE|nr:hypothetical protein AVEN_12083-1 [Araneus ventricosus]GBN18573.1 hypothetical protein AVEN_155679-1 [Araneus ventricosus]
MAKTRQSDNIFLLSVRDLEPLNRFNKLPTTKEVLLRFQHHLNDVKSVRNASHRTIDELIVVWSKAAIPTRLVKDAIEKLEKIHSEWLLLKKNKSHTSQAPREPERKFVRKVHELFNTAHANDMTMIKLEDRKFLIDQHSERNMIKTTLDKKLDGIGRVSERQRELQARKERASDDDAAASSTSKILSAAPLSSPDKSSFKSEEEFVPYFVKRKQETDSRQPHEQNVTLKKKLFSHHVTSALDRNKVSDCKAVRICSWRRQILTLNIPFYCS